VRLLKPFGRAVVRSKVALKRNGTPVAAVLLLTSSLALCQADLGPPASIVAGLQSKNEETRSTVAKLLDLKQSAPTQDYRTCDIRHDTARLDEQGGVFVLQIKCKNDVDVVVLRNHGGLSEVLSSRGFHAASDHWGVEFASLIGPSMQEIVIHNAALSPGADHKSYFLVLRLAGKRLEVVFSAIEAVVAPQLPGTGFRQQSKFTTVPASEAAPGAIGELTTVQTDGRTFAVRRSFGWSENLRAFVELEAPTIQPDR